MQAEHTNFRVVTWKEGFNYSAINNYGASFAKGEYLLLNNDTELIEEGSIKEMLDSARGRMWALQEPDFSMGMTPYSMPEWS